MSWRGLLAGLASLCMVSSMANAAITQQEWAEYSARFVSAEGRVVDDGNGGISHSEGQGYGLLLSFLGGNRPEFERIWSFTQRELLLRDDNLAAWRWDPNEKPHITDLNNASDGDILIAYSLALAGAAWKEERFTTSAKSIATALGRSSVFAHQDKLLILPGVAGFGKDARPDGPVVNLSYWVFEAFPVLDQLGTGTDWTDLSRSGVSLLEEASFGSRKLPADWISAEASPRPATGFPAEFGYNAVRIPLYLIRANTGDKELLRRLRDGMTKEDGSIVLVDFSSGKETAVLRDPGYRIISGLAACVLDGTRLPKDLQTFAPTLYYPSTLQLLALAYIREERRECL